MPDARKLQYRNYDKHKKILDLVLDINYISFSNPKPNLNPTHLPKHQTQSLNHQFSQRIWHVAYDCACAHGVKSEISLDTGLQDRILLAYTRIENAHKVRKKTFNFLLYIEVQFPVETLSNA